MVKISLFSQMLSLIPRDKFDRLVSKHASDKHQKRINSWTHLVAMLFCHIGGAASVRDISNGLTSTTGNQSHLGVSRVPGKSSLSYINKTRKSNLVTFIGLNLFVKIELMKWINKPFYRPERTPSVGQLRISYG